MIKESNGEERERIDCVEFLDVLHELDRPGTRGAGAFESAMEHAEGCGDCGVLLVEEESLGFALQRVALETAQMPGARRVEAALLKEFRQAKPERVVLPAPRKVRWQIAALGVAAAVLLVSAAAIYERKLTPSRVASVRNATPNQVQPAESGRTGPDDRSPVATPPSAASHDAGSSPKPPAAATDAHGTEYATAYVRLPYADDPAALEGGSVVRVRLARSALESYGFPTEGFGTADRVTADMLVSEDGTPEAIRLVAQEE